MLAGVVPDEVKRSTEYQTRMKEYTPPPYRKVHLPVFEAARRAVAVVDVKRNVAGKPIRITSIAPAEVLHEFKLGEFTRGTIVCFETVAAACRAPQQRMIKCSHRTSRQLLLLEVGVAGNGMSGLERGRGGKIVCNIAKAVRLADLPSSRLGLQALPPAPFWLPSGGTEPDM